LHARALGKGGGNKMAEVVMRLEFDAPEPRAQALAALQALLVRAPWPPQPDSSARARRQGHMATVV
jgi:hypothetical protein